MESAAVIKCKKPIYFIVETVYKDTNKYKEFKQILDLELDYMSRKLEDFSGEINILSGNEEVDKALCERYAIETPNAHHHILYDREKRYQVARQASAFGYRIALIFSDRNISPHNKEIADNSILSDEYHTPCIFFHMVI